jgi:Na+-translocating ferredoxin:NAD+ oxidoreductase RnfD subunit
MNRLEQSIVDLEEVASPTTMGDRVLFGLLVGIIVRVIIE